MRHKYPYIIILLVLIASVYIVLFNSPQEEKNTTSSITPTKTLALNDFTASFFIFTNGLQREFTNTMYHNLSADVYITANSPHTVYVKKTNTRWKDFFSTLPMGLSTTCLTTGTGQTFCDGDTISSQSAQTQKLTFILNGKEEKNVLEKNIDPGDVLLISFGSRSTTQLERELIRVQQQLSARSSSDLQEE